MLDLTGLRFDRSIISVTEVEWRSKGQISFPEATTEGSGVELSSLRFGVQVEAGFLAWARERERERKNHKVVTHYHVTIFFVFWVDRTQILVLLSCISCPELLRFLKPGTFFLVASKDGSFYCASYRLAPCLPCQFAFVVVGVLYMTPDQQLSTKILQDQGMCQTPAWKHWGGSNSVWVVESIDPHPHHVLQSECVCAHTMIFEYVKVV